jgi:hypothetical protein
MQTLTLAVHHARSWEPKRLRLRLFSMPPRHARTGRRRLLHLAATALALQALEARRTGIAQQQLADLGSTATIMAVAFVACHRLRSGVTRVLDPLAPSATPTAMSAV